MDLLFGGVEGAADVLVDALEGIVYQHPQVSHVESRRILQLVLKFRGAFAIVSVAVVLVVLAPLVLCRLSLTWELPSLGTRITD